MQYIVPQFIDVEDKIIGPLTFKQFMYSAGGLGLAFASYKLLPVIFGLPLALGFVALGGALTFFKVNGKPFVFILQAFVSFVTQSKLYIWKKEPEKEVKNTPIQQEQNQEQGVVIPKLTESRLGDLSWSLDILDMKEKDT